MKQSNRLENPAFNYDQWGSQYSLYRVTEPAIETLIEQTLGDAKSVLNVGAGAGSYEPKNRYVLAVEPSAEMRRQRMYLQKVPAIIATCDSLPFDDDSFDACLALVTVHHWSDIIKGLHEMRRVARKSVVVMTFDPDALDLFWNASYFPELIEVEKSRYPSIDMINQALGGSCDVIKVPIPLHCADGFQEAFYGRPEGFLNPEVRLSQSAWGFLSKEKEVELVERLENDLISGEWDKKYGYLREQPTFNGSLRLVVSRVK